MLWFHHLAKDGHFHIADLDSKSTHTTGYTFAIIHWEVV